MVGARACPLPRSWEECPGGEFLNGSVRISAQSCRPSSTLAVPSWRAETTIKLEEVGAGEARSADRASLDNRPRVQSRLRCRHNRSPGKTLRTLKARLRA